VRFCEGAIQIIFAEAGLGEASGAAATCFACRTSRFDFFETLIFLPNEIPRKGRPRVCFGFF